MVGKQVSWKGLCVGCFMFIADHGQCLYLYVEKGAEPLDGQDLDVQHSVEVAYMGHDTGGSLQRDGAASIF